MPTSRDRAPHRRHDRLLDDHRAAVLYSLVLIAGLVFMLVAVGKHPTDLAPETTLPAIGRFDARVYDELVPLRNGVTTAILTLFDLTGKGLVTIPLRIALVTVLLLRRRYAAATAFILVWISSEASLEVLKQGYMRGRPPLPLVGTMGFSFPSGHATAGAAIGASIVLAFLPPGHRRRLWLALAIALAFTMAFSRVYLGAHWLSDVVTGVLLGSVCAIGGFAIVDETRHRLARDPRPGHPEAT